jgi:hypothetical protein
MAAFSESSYQRVLPKCFSLQAYLKIVPLFFLFQQLEPELTISKGRTEMGLGVA